MVSIKIFINMFSSFKCAQKGIGKHFKEHSNPIFERSELKIAASEGLKWVVVEATKVRKMKMAGTVMEKIKNMLDFPSMIMTIEEKKQITKCKI
jgi:hypothetical protein